jgi:hypothetical protein
MSTGMNGMHRNSQNNYYRSYSYLPSSTSTYSEESTDYQHYDSRLPTEQSLYSNTTPIIIIKHASSRLHQPSTTISDLAEPLSVFDGQKFPRHLRSNGISFPSVHVPANPSIRRPGSDARLATASVMRERLLNDIQHNVSEIDEELFLLERRPSIPRHIPLRVSSINKKVHSSNNENQMRSNKPKRIYEVIPRITSESKTTPQHSTPKLTDRSMSHLYIGQYHYAAEIEEIEIVENDPENSDLKSTIDEIPRLSFHEILSLDQFRRVQSDALPQNRALIFVPEYRDDIKIKFNKTAKDSHQNDPTDTNIAQSSTIRSSQGFASANKLNIQTAPKPKIEISSPATRNPNGFSYMIETDLVNTMLSKPVKYTGPSKIMVTTIQEEPSSSQQTILNPTSSRKNDMDDNTAYFFSDVGDECDIVEAHIPFNPSHLALSTESKIIAVNINNGVDDEKELQSSSTFLYFI